VVGEKLVFLTLIVVFVLLARWTVPEDWRSRRKLAVVGFLGLGGTMFAIIGYQLFGDQRQPLGGAPRALIIGLSIFTILFVAGMIGFVRDYRRALRAVRDASNPDDPAKIG